MEQIQTLNEKILQILKYSNEEVWTTDDDLNDVSNEVFDPEYAAKEIEKLILNEQLELLKNFYYGEDLKDDDIRDHYKRVHEIAKEELTNQLNQL